MHSSKYYAGIGSRETPDDVLELMYELAGDFYNRGWTLRSGGAPGADQAFEWGAADQYVYDNGWNCAEIYLPWPSFEKNNRSWIHPRLMEPGPGAAGIAQIYHPRFKYLSYGEKKLMARNTHQVLGPNLENIVPSNLVLCWTKGAKGGGGTGQAIRIANAWEIPVYDLEDPKTLEIIMEILEVG
jgi:hypothetical protein